MKQSQLNRITNIIRGIKQARADLSGDRPVEFAMDVIMDSFRSDDDVIMTSERAAYLACMTIAWQDAGSPPLE